MFADANGPLRAVPPLSVVAATLVHFAEGTAAVSVTVAIDQGPDTSAAVVTLNADDCTLVVVEGDEQRTIPAVSAVELAAPLGRLHLHSFPPFDVEPELGEITGAIGAIDHLARSVIELASLFGGQSAAAAEYRTSIGGLIEIGGNARGEAALSVHGVEFETPDGWPSR